MATVILTPHEQDDYIAAKKGFLKKYYSSNLRPTVNGFYVVWDGVCVTFIDKESQIHFHGEDSRGVALQIDDLGGFNHAAESCVIEDWDDCILDSEFNGDPDHWLFWQTRPGRDGVMTLEEI